MDDRLKPRRKDEYLAMLPAPCQVCGLNCDVHNKNMESDRLSRYACKKVDWVDTWGCE